MRALASPIVPRPRLHVGRRRPGLTDVVVSSDLNPRYLGAWEVTRRAWREIGGVQPHLILVAHASEVPAAFAADPLVHVFEPVPGLHTAFQAQCIRLLYPALLETDGGVLTSDVDMIPLSRRYFHEPMNRVDERHFVAYRDVLLTSHEIPICYNAALPAVWSHIFGVRSVDDIIGKIAEWGASLSYDGARGGRGWHSDQLILYRTLVERGRAHRDVWVLRDAFSGIKRLPRSAVEGGGHLIDAERDRIRRGTYTDFHLLLPHEENRAANDEVARLAAGIR